MNKIVTLFYCMIFILLNEKIMAQTKAPKRNMGCITSYDCFDPRMICLKNRTCACAKFHDWEHKRKKCVVNLSKIYLWLKATMSTESEAISQQEDFEIEQKDNLTILHSKWAEYVAEEESGIGHITRVIWPIMLGGVIILLVYVAILSECM